MSATAPANAATATLRQDDVMMSLTVERGQLICTTAHVTDPSKATGKIVTDCPDVSAEELLKRHEDVVTKMGEYGWRLNSHLYYAA